MCRRIRRKSLNTPETIDYQKLAEAIVEAQQRAKEKGDMLCLLRKKE